MAAVTVRGSEKLIPHDIPEPSDIMLGQYSTQFCVALALFRDPLDPRAFSDEALHDDAIRSLCRKIRVERLLGEDGESPPWASVVHVTLKDGSQLERRAASFKGMPNDPISRTELAEKFNRLTRDMDAVWRERLLDRLLNLEQVDDLAGLGLEAKG